MCLSGDRPTGGDQRFAALAAGLLDRLPPELPPVEPPLDELLVEPLLELALDEPEPDSLLPEDALAELSDDVPSADFGPESEFPPVAFTGSLPASEWPFSALPLSEPEPRASLR